MAKQAKEPDPVPLFPDFRRRHQHLILPKLLTEKARLIFLDEAHVKTCLDELKRWSDLAAQGALQE